MKNGLWRIHLPNFYRKPYGAGWALVDYERRRNEASAGDFDENVALARFTPLRPEVLAIRAAVRERPDAATRFVKARMDMTDPGASFNPQNLQQFMAGAEPSTT